MKKISVILTTVLLLTLCACTVEKTLPAVYPGTVSENLYENPSVGLALRLDGEWLMNGATVSDGESYQDMYAVRSDGTASMQVSICHLNRMYGELLSADEYIDQITQELDADLVRAGYLNAHWERTAVDFHGEICSGVKWAAEYELEGKFYPYYTTGVYFKQGDYIVTVTAHSILDDITAELLGYFQ